MTELDIPLFIPPEDEGFLVQQDSEDGAATQALHSPPRKRARNLFEKPEDIMIPQYHGLEVVRDEDYYFSDGSCIIMVENTLFNVSLLFSSHKSRWFHSFIGTPDHSIKGLFFFQFYVFSAPRRQTS